MVQGYQGRVYEFPLSFRTHGRAKTLHKSGSTILLDARVYRSIRVWKRVMCRWSWGFTRLLMPRTLLHAVKLAMEKCYETIFLNKMIPGLVPFRQFHFH